MPIHESGEDYIETIYILKMKRGSVRSIDIAQELQFSRPSVSRAVGLLKENGLITVAEDGEIELSEKGLKKAKMVFERHTTLTKFLMLVSGVDFETAEKDGCRFEHIVSPETFKGIKKFMKEHKEEVDRLEFNDFHSVHF